MWSISCLGMYLLCIQRAFHTPFDPVFPTITNMDFCFFNAFINLASEISCGKNVYDLITNTVKKYVHLLNLIIAQNSLCFFLCVTSVMVLYISAICAFNCCNFSKGLNTSSKNRSTQIQNILYWQRELYFKRAKLCT